MMPSASDLAISTRGLRKVFGDKIAVRNLALDVPRGEVFGFLGPNGAGKSTSVKMLLGLVKPTAGKAAVLGKPCGDVPTRRKIGFLPEHFRFYEWLTGTELLGLHGRLYGMTHAELRTRVPALLELVGLSAHQDKRVHDFSKGMLQRIGLAQALLNDPELIFLDEPTSGLDPLGRLLVRDLMRELRGRGTTVFLNSHLLGEVEATCDRVVFVKQGRTVHERVLGTESRDLEVELRLGPTPPQVLSGLSEFGSGVTAVDGVVRLRVKSDAALPSIARWLVAHDVPLFEMRSRQPSLEQVFLEVMGSDQRPG